MRVSRLEIFGFKSFVERFVLNFDRNMIGIVGPNGCGKSNVVDSLRWVLGETHAKHLRGTVLDDLIFNGSESRRPLGMAEVSITVRPSEGWEEMVPESITLAEEPAAEIARAATESGEASATGAAEAGSETAAALSIASPAEEQITAQYNPRPAIFSEVPGLLGASEIQFTRRLYRSGESEFFINRVPCRLRDMIDIYRLIGLGARGLSIVQQGEIGQLISKKPVERRELLEEAAGISGFRTRMEAAQRKLEKTYENMARLKDIILEVEKQVKTLQRQAKRARDRNELRTELRQYDLDLYAARSGRVFLQKKHQLSIQESLESELDRVRSELTLAEAGQGELQAELQAFEIEISDRRRERDGLQHLLNTERTRLNDLKLQLALFGERAESAQRGVIRVDEKKQMLEAETEKKIRRQGELQSSLESVRERRQSAERALSEIQERARQSSSAQSAPPDFSQDSAIQQLLSEIERAQIELERLSEVESGLSAVQNELRSAEGARRSADAETNKCRLRLAGVESEVRSLSDQLEALAEHVVKATQAQSDQLPAGLNQVLLAGIQMDEALQRPVSAILGEKGHYLLSRSPLDLGKQYSQARQSGKSKDRVGIIDERFNDASVTADLSSEERAVAASARVLMPLLNVRPEFEGPAKAFLGAFLLVDSLEEALALNEANREAGRELRSLVTTSGELVFPWGWYSSEGKGVAFSFTRRIAEQREQAATLASEATRLEADASALEAKVAELTRAQGERQAERERLLQVQKRMVALRREEQDHERRIREAIRAEERRKQELFAAEERAAQGTLRQVVSELSSAEREVELLARSMLDVQNEIAALEGQKHSYLREHEELLVKHSEFEQSLAVSASGVNLEELQEKASALEETIRQIESSRNPVRLRLGEESERVSEFRQELQEFQDQFNRTSLEVERCALELNMLVEDVARQYPDVAQPTEAEIEAIMNRAGEGLDKLISETQEEANKIRRRIEREGEVDPQSIELYEEEETRLSGMKAQHSDLESASQILERTIRQLKEISRTRFLDTFRFVAKKFSELVPRLFGGGAGHLELVNPEDPLSSGVEIFVRPPGKKISNMELLSGGEKALVAVSVLLSMFLHRPSPICVLDEVDAPLDEANLERYLNLITEISEHTQFLVITHNKRTMSQVERLVGITMQERGVSTALTVSLEESENEINQWIANA